MPDPFMNLLLIEDDDELIRQLTAEFERTGDNVTIESNGRKGLEVALRGGWDIIILDVSLPEMSGFDIVSELRAAKIEVPILFLSARGDVNDRVRGLSLGGDDYLTKPFAIDELRARLNALGRRRGGQCGDRTGDSERLGIGFSQARGNRLRAGRAAAAARMVPARALSRT